MSRRGACFRDLARTSPPHGMRAAKTWHPATHSVDPFPPLESTNILSREREPFTLFAFAGKPHVPIVLDASGIIRFDVMDWLKFLGKLDPKLTFPSERVVRPADFVLSPRTVLEEIDIP